MIISCYIGVLWFRWLLSQHCKKNLSGSLAERMVDRGSLSRASLGRGSLGRFSVATDVSASSAATRHWVNSVSDIYGQDEIEELLQDLNRLELATLDTDKFQVSNNSLSKELEPKSKECALQEFDIDGSHVGGIGLDLPPSPSGHPASSPLLPRPRSPGAVSRYSKKNVALFIPICCLQPVLGQPHTLPAVQGTPGRLRLGGT